MSFCYECGQTLTTSGCSCKGQSGAWNSCYYPLTWEWPQKGWECPKCGRCYSPTTIMCFYCGNLKETDE
jgi:hypothetical protein